MSTRGLGGGPHFATVGDGWTRLEVVVSKESLVIVRSNLSAAIVLVNHVRHHDHACADETLSHLRAALEPLGGEVTVDVEKPDCCLTAIRASAGCMRLAHDYFNNIDPTKIVGSLTESQHALRQAHQAHRTLVMCVELEHAAETGLRPKAKA